MFDLGIALTLRDRASGGIRGFTSILVNLSSSVDSAIEKMDEFDAISRRTGKDLSMVKDLLAGQVFSDIGSSILDVGTRMGESIVGLAKNIMDTSQTVFNSRLTIDKLYGGADEGAKAFERMASYAAKSVFEFKDLLGAMTLMKAVGIEITDMVSTSSGKYRQTVLDYAADLAAVFPEMRNMYGRGITAAMGAIKEYVSEGNEISLRRGAGLDITGILGESKGQTQAERSRQVADLLEKINAIGMTKSLQGTPAQRLSNVNDIIFNLKRSIADGGKAWEKYTAIVNNLTKPLDEIGENSKELGKSLGEAFSVVVDPVVWLSKVVGDFIPTLVKLIKEHPIVVKFAVALAGAASVAMTLAGAVIAVAGALFLFKSSVAFLLPVITKLSMGFRELLGINSLAVGVGKYALAAYLIYQAYSKNFMGLKNLVFDVLNVFSALFSFLNGESISEEQFKYLRERGLVPLVEDLYLFAQNMKAAFKGVVEGVQSAGKAVVDFLTGFSENSGMDLSDTIKSFRDFFEALDFVSAKGDPEKLKKIREEFAEWGKLIGKYIVPLLFLGKIFWTIVGALGVIERLIKAIFSPFTKVFKFIFGNLFKGMMQSKEFAVLARFIRIKFKSTLSSGLSTAFGFLRTKLVFGLWHILKAAILTAGKLLLGLLGGWPLAIIAALAIIAVIMYKYWDEICEWVGKRWEEFTTWLSNTWDEVCSYISEKISSAWEKVKETLQPVVDMFNRIYDLVTNIAGTITSWGGNALTQLSDAVVGAADGWAKRNLQIVSAQVKEESPSAVVPFASGGETRGQGLAYLHKNEAILNSPTLDGLKKFLTSYRSTPTQVTFGNITIQVEKVDSTTDLESAADKLMRIIGRKMQLRKMAER